jgi:hypothetical protein
VTIINIVTLNMACVPALPVTSGGKGLAFTHILRSRSARANHTRAEYIERTVEVLTPAFQDDPLFAWLMHQYPVSEHQTVLSKLLRGFLTQGSLNTGIFVEVDDFGCCGLFMPPGTSIGNPWTLLQAGLIPALFTIGPKTFKVQLLS